MADHIRFVRDQHGQKNRPKRITNFNFVGSYSWVVEDPTNPSRSSWICAPGEAPMYMRNRANNEQLQKDTRDAYIKFVEERRAHMCAVCRESTGA